MRSDEVTARLLELCANRALSFQGKAEEIERSLTPSEGEELLGHLDNAGIIPECFDHDSTEEKLFAKYCDALLAKTLRSLGMNAEVIAERADAADVTATLGGYRLVGDAEAFRLRRTAQNPKDFHVK